MTYRLFISVFCICLPVSIMAQYSDYTKFRELSAGIGSMDYMNSAAIPSGLPGTIYRLEYHSGKISKLNTNRSYEFVARADYAYMFRDGLNTDLNIPYHHAEIRLGAICTQNIPVSIPNVTLNAGLGLSLNMLAGYNPTYTYGNTYDILYPYENWYVSPDLHFDIKYQLNKFIFKGGFYMPILITGYFQEFQNAPFEVYNLSSFFNYYISPNTFTLFTNYFRFDSYLSAMYLLKKTNKTQLYLKANYTYESLNSTIHFNSEKKQKQMLSIGFVILRK